MERRLTSDELAIPLRGLAGDPPHNGGGCRLSRHAFGQVVERARRRATARSILQDLDEEGACLPALSRLLEV